MKSTICVLITLSVTASAFTPSSRIPGAFTRITQQENNNKLSSSQPVSDRAITQLAFGRDEDQVKVKGFANVDAATLTALGFGAIAFNFLVLGNMGDMGIGGLVARFINTFM
jgi:hypothetical protein